MSNVTIIPARKKTNLNNPIPIAEAQKVAGYARVSTDHDEQLTSYEAQVDYYTSYINKHDDWEFAGIYTDEGITATSTKRRKGFNQMVEDAPGRKDRPDYHEVGQQICQEHGRQLNNDPEAEGAWDQDLF